ncbi:uncharacterized protein METZ01_LOCUS480893, partial [marine metagenome]
VVKKRKAILPICAQCWTVLFCMQVYGDPCENSCMLGMVMLVIIVMLIFKTTLTMLLVN